MKVGHLISVERMTKAFGKYYLSVPNTGMRSATGMQVCRPSKEDLESYTLWKLYSLPEVNKGAVRDILLAIYKADMKCSWEGYSYCSCCFGEL